MTCFDMSDVCMTQILLPSCEADARAGPCTVTLERSDSSAPGTQGEGSRATEASVPHCSVRCIVVWML